MQGGGMPRDGKVREESASWNLHRAAQSTHYVEKEMWWHIGMGGASSRSARAQHAGQDILRGGQAPGKGRDRSRESTLISKRY